MSYQLLDYRQNFVSVHLYFTMRQFLRPHMFQQDILAQSTISHKDAVLKTITLLKTKQDIGKCLSKQHAHENRECQQCLLKLLSNIPFLVWQGLPLHGEGMNPTVTMYNCWSCKERMIPEYMTGFEEWLTNILTRNSKWNNTSMAFKVLQELVSFLHAPPLYMAMMDETTDMWNCEQVMFFF